LKTIIRRFFALFIGLSVLLLSACQSTLPSVEPTLTTDSVVDMPPTLSGVYLTFNITTNNNGRDAQDGCTMNNYCYDIESKKITKVQTKEALAYNSQYPLSVFSKIDNSIYYSDRVTREDGKYGDQLAVYNLDTEERKILTDNLYAINEIIPLEDYVVLSACPQGSRGEQLIIYDKTKEKSRTVALLTGPEDSCVSSLSYNPNTGQLIAAVYSMAQEYKARDDFNNAISEYNIVFYACNSTIYQMSAPDFSPKIIWQKEGTNVMRMALDNDGQLLVTTNAGSVSFPSSDPELGNTIETVGIQTRLFDLADGTEKKLVSIDDMLVINSTFLYFNGDQNEVFFIGVSDTDEKSYPRGIYSYNYDSNKLTLIYSQGDGWLNNFYMLAR
jgi:hypothetical protein